MHKTEGRKIVGWMTSIQDKATLEEQANTTHTRSVWRENKTLERGKRPHKNLVTNVRGWFSSIFEVHCSHRLSVSHCSVVKQQKDQAVCSPTFTQSLPVIEVWGCAKYVTQVGTWPHPNIPSEDISINPSIPQSTDPVLNLQGCS